MSNPYSTLKAAWHIDRIADLRAGRQIVPVELQLILSDLCNHDCHFCAYRASNGLSNELFADESGNTNPNRMIHRDKAEEIIKDAATMGIKSVIFTGGGEPTVHPHHMELFELALSKGLECSLNTNGNLLRKGWQGTLPRFAYVRFSIDAGTAEEYAAIRAVKPSVYGKVLRHLSEFVNEVKEQESDCVVGAGYVVTPANYVNLEEGLKNLKDTGVSYVRLAAMQSTDGELIYGDDYSNAQAACEQAERISDDDFKVVNLFDAVLGSRPDYEFCGFQQFVTYVGADLNVYRCCYTAYTEHGTVGSLKNQSLSNWWNSQDKINKIAEFNATSCQTCPLNSKNRTINYMIGTPTHVNFV